MSDILTLNAGSSSIKFALFSATGELTETLSGQIEGLGAKANLQIHLNGERIKQESTAQNHMEALHDILLALKAHKSDADIRAVGHRIVHGGPDYAAPVVLTDNTYRP